jgi:drug/metabolite transporter (DMT)-like permease
MTPASLALHLLLCSALWSTSFILIKLLGSDVSLFTVAALRGLAGAGTLIVFFLLSGRSLLPERRELVPWLIFGSANGWVPNVLTVYAMGQIAAATGAMIQASGPVIVAALAHMLMRGERLSLRRAGGVALGFLGVATLIGPERIMAGGGALAGVVAMLLVAVSYALGSLYARTVRDIDVERMALGQQVVSALPALGLALVFDPLASWAVAAAHWRLVLFFGVLSTAVPMILYLRIIRAAGPVRAGTVGYLQPVWATVAAWLVLGETVGPREIAGMLVVFAGVWIVSRR